MNVYVVLENRIGYTGEVLIGVCRTYKTAMNLLKNRAAVWGTPSQLPDGSNIFVSGDYMLRIREEWLQ